MGSDRHTSVLPGAFLPPADDGSEIEFLKREVRQTHVPQTAEIGDLLAAGQKTRDGKVRADVGSPQKT